MNTKPEEGYLADAVRSDADLYFIAYDISSNQDPFIRAAIALYKIACRHPFVEGNKRTALAMCELMLGYPNYIDLPLDVSERYILEVAQDLHTVNDVVKWLKKNVSP